MKNIALILASGTGERTGLNQPKQFFEVGGKTLLEHSVEAFERHSEINSIIIVAHPDFLERTLELVGSYKKVIKVISGGATRQESSYKGVFSIDEADNVLIHDSVRAFVSQDVISACIAGLKLHDAVCAAVETSDTILELNENGQIISVPQRDFLRCAQTPQCFKLSLIKQAHEFALQRGIKVTDDCGLVLTSNLAGVYTVCGSPENMKITYPKDLILARLVYDEKKTLLNRRIAFVTNGYSNKNFSSGGVKLNFMLLQKFVEAGYNVDVYSNNFYDVSQTKGIRTFDMRELKSIEQYELVLSSNAIYPADVTYIHDHTNIFRFKHMYNPIRRCLYRIFKPRAFLCRIDKDKKRNKVLLNTKKIIVSSEILKSDYVNNYNLNEDKFIVIPPPVVLPSEVVEQPVNKTFVFGLSAVGFTRKGGYITLDAISRMKRKRKDFKVRIIYPEKNLFINFLIFINGLKDNIEIINCQKDMTEFYNGIDCLLMPSKLEPFGMVAIEAMVSGKPVIVSKIAGAADFVRNGYNGYVVDNSRNFSANLADAMQKMLEIPYKDYKIMCENAFTSVKSLDVTNFFKRFMNLIESIDKNT